MALTSRYHVSVVEKCFEDAQLTSVSQGLVVDVYDILPSSRSLSCRAGRILRAREDRDEGLDKHAAAPESRDTAYVETEALTAALRVWADHDAVKHPYTVRIPEAERTNWLQRGQGAPVVLATLIRMAQSYEDLPSPHRASGI
ncbi:hypothetical protein LA080_003044 [Diaporthe eres]|nr:hypothetical protein LA080_003044 [Diaporthe eres]